MSSALVTKIREDCCKLKVHCPCGGVSGEQVAAGHASRDRSRDPNFEGFAIQDTDAEGRYRFKTIKPGAYPATANWMRPPHLHFEVTGKINRMITQMYFPAEPLNDKDLLLQNIRANKDGLIAKVLPPTSDVESDSLIVVWDIVLDKG
jgi:protocatechuate 3,4-dioxygenase beta subunit